VQDSKSVKAAWWVPVTVSVTSDVDDSFTTFRLTLSEGVEWSLDVTRTEPDSCFLALDVIITILCNIRVLIKLSERNVTVWHTRCRCVVYTDKPTEV